MDPPNTHSRGRFRPAPIIWALGIALPLLIVGYVGYFVVFEMRPYYDSVTWYYDEFRIVGSPADADGLRAEDTLPRNIIVEELSGRFVPPDKTVLETGRRVELSTITWDSAIAMSIKEPLRLPRGEDMVEMLDPVGVGSSHITVDFESQRFKSISAWGHVRIHNTVNGRSFDLRAKWSDVERVFGKPYKKEKKRHYHGKWA